MACPVLVLAAYQSWCIARAQRIVFEGVEAVAGVRRWKLIGKARFRWRRVFCVRGLYCCNCQSTSWLDRVGLVYSAIVASCLIKC